MTENRTEGDGIGGPGSEPVRHGVRSSRPAARPGTTGEFLALLSDRRCRYVLDLVTDRPEPVPVAELASTIAARESGDPDGESISDHERRIRISLVHTVLPRLTDHGLIEHDQGSDTVTGAIESDTLGPYPAFTREMDSSTPVSNETSEDGEPQS